MTVVSAVTPAYDHIVVVVEENHSYDQIIGNPQAPYINALASGGALLTNYHAITHPSQPNYFALYAGSTFGVTDNADHSEPDPTLATILQQAGKSFVGYVETGSPRKHNPWESFPEGFSVESNLSNFPVQDFTQLPTVAFVVPNQDDDMHDGSIAQGDQWLSDTIDSYARWAGTHNSLLVVVWDEDNGTAGNHIPAILYGANVNAGSDGTSYDHYDLLRTLLDASQLGAPNNAATASTIGNGTFFNVAISDGASDTLTGSSTRDALYGRDGDDRLVGNGGDDALYGDAGNDTAVYSGYLANYTDRYDATSATFTVADQRPGAPDGTDLLAGIERFEFADGVITNTFDGAGRLVAQNDGNAAALPWASQQWTYDGAGRLTTQTVDNDNSTRWTSDYDAAGTQGWSWIVRSYDTGHHLVAETRSNDDGTHALTLYDVANDYSWLQATVTFDAGWAVTGVSGSRDSGTQPVTMADIAAAYDTLLWFPTPYDANWNAHHDLLVA